MEFTIQSTDLLWICSFIIAVWGVIKIIKEIRKPSEDLRHQVEINTEQLDDEDTRIKQIEEDNKIICKALMVMINHSITGNGLNNMKEVRDELQNYLITR